MKRIGLLKGFRPQWQFRCMVIIVWWVGVATVLCAKDPVVIADSVVSHTGPMRVRVLWHLTYPPELRDTLTTLDLYTSLQKEFEKRGEDQLRREMWTVNVFYQCWYRSLYDPAVFKVLDKEIEFARDQHWKQQEAECTMLKGVIFYRQERYGPAFEFIEKGVRMMEPLGYHTSYNFIHWIDLLGICYYDFGDYEGAIRLYEKAVRVDPQYLLPGSRHHALNTMALCYKALRQYERAIEYFKEAREEALSVRDTFWAALTNGNIGSVYFLQGKDDLALPLFREDFDASYASGDIKSAVNAATSIATLLLRSGQHQEAESYLQLATRHVGSIPLKELPSYYTNMAHISKLKGQYTEALRMMDSAAVYARKVNEVLDTRFITQARHKLEVEQHAQNVLLLEASRSRQVLMRNGLLIIVLLGTIIAILWINRSRLKRRKEEELQALKQRKTEEELHHAQRQLHHYMEAVRDKNLMIDRFRNELDAIQKLDEARGTDRTAYLEQLMHSVILTEEDWKEFRMLFDKVYPGFFIRLKEKWPDLSPADTRLLALTKLQLAPREMASMLGISYEAIKKSRQRLRKKVNLPEEGSLDELAEMV